MGVSRDDWAPGRSSWVAGLVPVGVVAGLNSLYSWCKQRNTTQSNSRYTWRTSPCRNRNGTRHLEARGRVATSGPDGSGWVWWGKHPLVLWSWFYVSGSGGETSHDSRGKVVFQMYSSFPLMAYVTSHLLHELLLPHPLTGSHLVPPHTSLSGADSLAGL